MRIFRAPTLYVQGPGALSEVGARAAPLGRIVVAICDRQVLPAIKDALDETLLRQDIERTIIPFDGDVTHAEIERLATTARHLRADVIVGVGGGRALDTAKGVSRRTGAPFVSVPTAASTDAPSTRGVVVYDEHHMLVGVEQMDDNSAAVLVDTTVIASAPARLLRGGIGDALTAKFEAEGNWAGTGLSKQGTRPLRTGVLLGRACYETLLEFGVEAMETAGTGVPTEAFENVVEAVLWMSAVAFENTGLSIAHAVATELGAIAPVRTGSLHGEHAAYGTLVQALTEGRSEDELKELFEFCRVIGLPLTLSALGLPDGDQLDRIDRLAEAVARSALMVNQRRLLGASDIAAAIREVEARGGGIPARAAFG